MNREDAIQQRMELTNDCKQVFGTEAGKRVFDHIANTCCAKYTTYNSDPAEMARRSGKREVFLDLVSLLETTEVGYRNILALSPHHDNWFNEEG